MDGTRMKAITCVEIDGRPFLLRGDRALGEVMADIEAAASGDDPKFVQLIGGEDAVSVLVSSRTRVIVTVRHDRVDHIAPDESTHLQTEDWDL
ncbi:hypothetical protein [uncultured Microbacterium sp.]|uniref:hypothetical protein n=1 Tax=uncultured Microbacterium sp. TaxID=191216 RepID=UPI002617A1DB|nr:hypothetical protein [uncultured Microbacterium sp.]